LSLERVEKGDIFQALDRGDDYAALCERFGAHRVERPLKKILNQKPGRLAQAFGVAASDKRVLLDICFGSQIALMQMIYKHVGLPQYAGYFMQLAGKGASATDNQIAKEASKKGISAIFTCDSARGSHEDMIPVMQRLYGKYDPSRHPFPPPALVVFPQGGKFLNSRISVLERNIDTIRAYIANHPVLVARGQGDVLDLSGSMPGVAVA